MFDSAKAIAGFLNTQGGAQPYSYEWFGLPPNIPNFLDQITNRTIEILHQRIFDFKKPYSKYMEIRKELRTQQLAAQKNQEKQIQQTEKLIERFRAKASKASMAQSLIKKLDKIER